MSITHRKTLTVLLVLALVWLSRSLLRVYQQRAEVADQLRGLESKISGIEHDNEFLASASAYFSSNAYLERQARLKLNYKLPDEEVAFVYKDPSVAKETPPAQALKDQIAKMPNWKKWLYYLLGY